MAHPLEKVVHPKRKTYSDMFADYYMAKFQVHYITETWETKRVVIPFDKKREEKVKAYLGLDDLTEFYERLFHLYNDELIQIKRMESEEDKNLTHFILRMKTEMFEDGDTKYFYFISPMAKRLLAGESFTLKDYISVLLRTLYALKQKIKGLGVINPLTVCTFIDNRGNERCAISSITEYAGLYDEDVNVTSQTAKLFFNVACGLHPLERVECEPSDAYVPLPLADILKSIGEEATDAKVKKAIGIAKNIEGELKNGDIENTVIRLKPLSLYAEEPKEEPKETPKEEPKEEKPEDKVPESESPAEDAKEGEGESPEAEGETPKEAPKEETPKEEEPKEEPKTEEELKEEVKQEPEKVEEETPKEAEEDKPTDTEVEYELYHDFLTSCKNRRCFDKDIKEREDFTLVSFDVNNLKETNDTLGHNAGDMLLTVISSEIRKEFGDNLYRIGGDEFSLILERNVKA